MTELTYSCVGEYSIPNLAVPEKPPIILGKYVLLRKKYLKQNRRILFVNLLTSGKLNEHLTEIENTAMRRVQRLTVQMAVEQGVTEQMKAENQLLWVGAMNNIKACIEEIINEDLICV